MITVLIADDSPVMRIGLKLLLDSQPDLEVSACVADGEEAVAMCRSTSPRVVVMDLAMPRLDGLAATRALATHGQPPWVVVVTGTADQTKCRDAAEAGAAGFVLKSEPPEVLLEAIRAVTRGERRLGPVCG
ncbi:MAG TPA: response regulator transcription factor [Intrasporangium sp.]|uniref:response regulator n=1 Tax=Intrasporangium sp. TaxID=1925024 RepID=UPI002D76F326|nr:response regulator transcription factor [Intrasporangium sp.]HET7398770.1 response regulator transcription factor [Intrasporangium sp.]